MQKTFSGQYEFFNCIIQLLIFLSMSKAGNICEYDIKKSITNDCKRFETIERSQNGLHGQYYFFFFFQKIFL